MFFRKFIQFGIIDSAAAYITNMTNMLSYQCPLDLNTNTSTKSSLGKYSESTTVYGSLEKKL